MQNSGAFYWSDVKSEPANKLSFVFLQGDVERKLSQMILDKKFHGKSFKFIFIGVMYKELRDWD